MWLEGSRRHSPSSQLTAHSSPPMARRRKRNPNQLEMNLRRPPKKKRGRPVSYAGRDARVPHRERPRFTRRAVVGITLRLVDGLPSLRSKRFVVKLRAAFEGGCDKQGFRICQFSIQGNHLHLVCEADNHVALAKGMQAFAVRIARAVNRIARRTGRVFNDRYHVRYVNNASQLRRLLAYVLLNHRRHDRRKRGVDPFSSARHFDGWSRPPEILPVDCATSPVAPARTHLLNKGWRYCGLGLIDPEETPPAAFR